MRPPTAPPINEPAAPPSMPPPKYLAINAPSIAPAPLAINEESGVFPDMPCAFILSAFAAAILSSADMDMSDWMAVMRSEIVGSSEYANLIARLLCCSGTFMASCSGQRPGGIISALEGCL